jgi:ubiquinone/menaquinone biosynthesis C-methylase UbiE
MVMGIFRRFMRFFFHHFYHDFAWTYGFVAAVVSLGRWDDWIQTVIPYVRGLNILEIGHGPGHLQSKLRAESRLVVGLDESKQMGRIAKQHLVKAHQRKFDLARGRGEMLPFASATFDAVVSTFPTEYIFDTHTLLEVHRVLRAGGLLVILPAAWIVGQRLLERSAAWLFKVTGQAPDVPQAVIGQRLQPSFEKAGFTTELHTVEIGSSVVLIIVARKSLGGI